MTARLRTTLAEQVDPARTAVVVIDVQKDFCASDGVMARVFGLDLTDIQQAVPRLNKFVAAARDAGVRVVWVREIFSPSRMMPNHRVINGEGPNLLLIREGSDGTDWYEGLDGPITGEPVFTKWNYDAFDGTEIDLWLRAQGIDSIVMTGFTTNVCVETTARHAYIKGYYVTTLSDCTGAPSRTEHEAALVNLGRYFGRVASSDEVIASWASNPVAAR